jgi:hypothetical protein
MPNSLDKKPQLHEVVTLPDHYIHMFHLDHMTPPTDGTATMLESAGSRTSTIQSRGALVMTPTDAGGAENPDGHRSRQWYPQLLQLSQLLTRRRCVCRATAGGLLGQQGAQERPVTRRRRVGSPEDQPRHPTTYYSRWVHRLCCASFSAAGARAFGLRVTSPWTLWFRGSGCERTGGDGMTSAQRASRPRIARHGVRGGAGPTVRPLATSQAPG